MQHLQKAATLFLLHVFKFWLQKEHQPLVEAQPGFEKCDRQCPGFAGGKHPNAAQRATRFPQGEFKVNKFEALYCIPAELCDVVAGAVVEKVLFKIRSS